MDIFVAPANALLSRFVTLCFCGLIEIWNIDVLWEYAGQVRIWLWLNNFLQNYALEFRDLQ